MHAMSESDFFKQEGESRFQRIGRPVARRVPPPSDILSDLMMGHMGDYEQAFSSPTSSQRRRMPALRAVMEEGRNPLYSPRSGDDIASPSSSSGRRHLDIGLEGGNGGGNGGNGDNGGNGGGHSSHSIRSVASSSDKGKSVVWDEDVASAAAVRIDSDSDKEEAPPSDTKGEKLYKFITTLKNSFGNGNIKVSFVLCGSICTSQTLHFLIPRCFFFK